MGRLTFKKMAAPVTSPVSCTAAGSLFKITCMDNLVIKLEPIIAVDAGVSTNCFTKAYADLTLADLIVSPEGNDNDDGKTCDAAVKAKADYVDNESDNKFWGAATLDTAVSTSAIYFSASSCGIEGAVTQVENEEYMQFKTTVMSKFNADTGAVLTQQHMLETDIICNYELSVDGIMVAIAPQLDAVLEENKIDQDEDTNEIAESEVSTTITVNDVTYVDGADVTLGNALKIDFSAIGELTSGYYIDSCVADNELVAQLADGGNNPLYKNLDLVANGCALTAASDPSMASINPQLGATSTDLSFEQFAFVDASSTFDAPVLKFELNCVLKFGTAPSCDPAVQNRRRRATQNANGDTMEPVSISIPVIADGAINYSGGIATAGPENLANLGAKSAESGATEMLVSAMAAAGFLML